MKRIHFRKWERNEGSVLIIGVITAAILCFLLVSYLSLVSQQNALMARSQAWNAAMGMAEAGVEEAMAQLAPGILPTTNLPTGNGWVLITDKYQPTPQKRDLIGGSYYACYTPVSPATIYSTGYTTVPAVGATIKRTVEVKTKYVSIFSVGILAKSNINLSGNALLSNSYDSTDNKKSDNGLYSDASAQPHGDIASPYGIVDLGNRDISGTLFLGPTATLYTNSNAKITGGINNDFNVDVPDVLEPYPPNNIKPKPGTNDLKDYKYVLGANNYTLPSLSSSDSIYVDSPYAVLYVTGNANLPSITFNTANGAKLKIYVAGASTTMTSVNAGGIPANLQYFGLPSNKSINMNGNDQFVGTIYAPSAYLEMKGGGSGGYFWGALVVNSLKSTGNFAIHYDESLNRGPSFKLVAASWKEL